MIDLIYENRVLHVDNKSQDNYSSLSRAVGLEHLHNSTTLFSSPRMKPANHHGNKYNSWLAWVLPVC